MLPFPKYRFPDEHRDKSRLAYYATLYNSVEINNSFYKIPMPATVLRWTREVPQHFKFTFKLWKGITHNKFFDFKTDDVFRFMKCIELPAENKGCILIQLPPSTGYIQMPQLESLLGIIQDLNTGSQWNIAIEFRNDTWYRDEVYEAMNVFNVSIVVHDIPKSATPSLQQLTGFMYVRYHGPEGGYRGSYTDDFLHEYAQYIHEWLREDKKVFVYFNNTAGDALNNLNTLMKGINVGIGKD